MNTDVKAMATEFTVDYRYELAMTEEVNGWRVLASCPSVQTLSPDQFIDTKSKCIILQNMESNDRMGVSITVCGTRKYPKTTKVWKEDAELTIRMSKEDWKSVAMYGGLTIGIFRLDDSMSSVTVTPYTLTAGVRGDRLGKYAATVPVINLGRRDVFSWGVGHHDVLPKGFTVSGLDSLFEFHLQFLCIDADDDVEGAAVKRQEGAQCVKLFVMTKYVEAWISGMDETAVHAVTYKTLRAMLVGRGIEREQCDVHRDMLKTFATEFIGQLHA